MDDELKVVVSSVLEADVDESAQRIASQLPSIAEKVNAKSTIKIGVELERNTTQNMTQQISRELSKVSRQTVGVSVKLDTSAIQKFQSELDKLGVNDKVTQAISAEMDSMGVRIDQIGGAWKEAAEGERQLLNLTIQGTDQLGRKVTIAKQFAYTLDEETAELKEQSSTIMRMTADLEKQRQAAERLAAQEEKDNQKRLNDVASYEASLQRIQALYNGEKGTKPLTDQLHLDDVIAKCSQIEEAITALKAKQGAASEEERRNIKTQISELDLLVQKYQSVEYVATKLRTKTVVQVNTEQVEKLKEFEERLRSAGILTQEFQDRINNLRGDLGKAFDNKSLTEYLNGFDRLQSDVASFQEKIRSINSIYTELGKISSKIGTIQREIVGLNPADAALKEQLAIYEEQKAQLEAQLIPYGTMLDYAKQKTVYEQQAKVLAGELAIAVSDNIAKIDTAMQSIPSAVEAIRARFTQLSNPTQELIHRVSQLDAEMRAVSEAKTDQEKIAAYQKLAETIKYCRTEVTNLSAVQRKDTLDVKFTAGLEKAKADLATISRTWSALKQDPGLNAQFLQLTQNLKNVNNQMDLNKWTAQFSAFKSEVKAAGLNVQSLADTLKNNLGKVMQWVSATTLLFRAFRLLKSAVSTVVDLNTAIVDLRKVTTGTTADYEAFYQSANDTAKVLNATTEAVISQTAEWARLGYSLKDAAKLAENAMVFAAVSPGMDQDAATDGLVSIIKAYGIEVEDTMDGIISKVNDIGNKFAVSNADIVEALMRSSSAMAAANNTFEETVALATAAIEITRDANTVGNALKTLSMRIRGYDEETEEYSEDVAVLTGKIADFTRTASNPTGVTLFTDATNQTYRSTYEILSDIADIFDEISDVDQARLLENLFGKRQAQVGAAILSNFDQARDAIEKMEQSSGSADREMEKIMDSLEYRINALKETWVGVAQNLFQQEDLKVFIGVLTTLSNLVDSLTSGLGLFGTVALANVIVWLAKVKSSVGAINTAITPVIQTVANINFDGSAASALQYAAALSGLDAAQQKVVMSASGLSAAEQAQVMDMMKVIAVTKQYTVAELEKALGMDADTIAASLNVSATAMVTEELLRAAIANGTLSAEQLKAVVSTNAQTNAMIAQAGAAQTLGVAMKSAAAAMLANPISWVTIALSLLPMVIRLVKTLHKSTKELIEAGDKAFEAITEKTEKLGKQASGIDELAESYAKLSNGVDLLTNKNISLSDEDFKEYVETANKLAELFPDLIKGTDEYGNYILDLSGSYEQVNRKLQENLELERQRAAISARSNGDDIFAGAKAESVEPSKKLHGLENELQYFEELIKSLDASNGVIDKYDKLYSDIWASISNLELDITPEFITMPAGNGFKLNNFDEVKLAFEKEISRLKGELNVYQTDIKNAWSNVAETLKAAILDDETYKILNDEQQAMVQRLIDGLDYSSLNFDSWSDAYHYVLQNVIPAISGGEDFEGVEIPIDLTARFENNSISVGEFQDKIDAFFAQLDALEADGKLDHEVVVTIKAMFDLDGVPDVDAITDQIMKSLQSHNQGLRETIHNRLSGFTGSELDSFLQFIGDYDFSSFSTLDGMLDDFAQYAEKAADSSEDFSEKLQGLSDAFSDAADRQMDLYKALYDLNELDSLDIETYQKLVKLIPELAGEIRSVADAQAALKDAIHDANREAFDAYVALFQMDEEWVNKTVNSSEYLSNALASYYGDDVINWQKTADAKWDVDKRLVGSLSELWSKYIGTTTKELESMGYASSEFKHKYYSGLLSQDEIDKYNEVTAVLALRRQLEKDFDEMSANFYVNYSASKDKKSSSSKTTKEYTADIDDHREAIERLNRVQLEREAIEEQLSNGSDLETQIALQKKLVGVYQEEQDALKTLANLRRQTLAEGAVSLRKLGFDVEYNAENDQFFVRNLEHLNDLTANSKGKYDSLQEATNELRKDTEDLIEKLEKLNQENQEGTKSCLELADAIHKARIAIYDNSIQKNENTVTLNENWLEQAVAGDDYDGVKQYTGNIVDLYRDMQKTVHEEADYYRALGYSDTSDEVSKLSDLWWDYEANIVKANNDAYDAVTKSLQNHVGLTEHWFDKAAANKDLAGVEQYANEIISYNKDIQKNLHQQADYLRSKGYSDTSDEIRKLSDGWYDCADAILSAKQRVVDYLYDIVSATSEAVDSIQNVYSTLKDAAEEFASSGGFISIDAYQAIIELGPQYMQYLRDENGLLVINEEGIQRVIAAKTRQLALDNAMTYVERLRLALEKDSIEDLNELLFATNEVTDATWGMVYANLAMLDLNDEQYAAALHNINSVRSLADAAVDSIGKTAGGALDGFDSILNYVMEMLKQQTSDQIEALKEMKEQFAEIIDQRKEALDLAKQESKHQDDVADKVKNIAQLQARIDALSLDDSREAKAERAKLEEELANEQKELNDMQSDYAIENQKDALDQMKDGFDKEKDAEIDKLEESISSHQKLYEKAIDYIRTYWENNWGELKDELLQWNYDVGSNLQSEIETAWDNCTKYIENNPLALDDLLWKEHGGASSGGGSGGNAGQTGGNQTVGHSGNEYVADAEKYKKIVDLVSEMKKNSDAWHGASKEDQARLSQKNLELAGQVSKLLGETLTRGKDGEWYLPDGKKLYDVFLKYHTGGIVGVSPSLQSNEVVSILKKGEAVLTSHMWSNVKEMIDRITQMKEAFSDAKVDLSGAFHLDYSKIGGGTVNHVATTNNRPVDIRFGDTIINGSSSDAVAQHIKVNRAMANEIIRTMRLVK